MLAPISFIRGKRAVHAEGIVCDAELVALPPYQRLSGPAVVRLSGAISGQRARSDILGFALRLQRRASRDPREGDQDLLFGTFESFFTLRSGVEHTHADDYLTNHYSSVSPWWIAEHGPVVLRLEPQDHEEVISDGDRLARLDAAIAEDRARFALVIAPGRPLAEIVLHARRGEAPDLRMSMFRNGRGIRPLGFRNGIRAIVYPINQSARRLRDR